MRHFMSTHLYKVCICTTVRFKLANVFKTCRTMKTIFLIVAIAAGVVFGNSIGKIDKNKLKIELKKLLAAIKDESSFPDSDEGDFPVQPIKLRALKKALSFFPEGHVWRKKARVGSKGYVRVCVCVCVRVCVCACVRACVRACARACVCGRLWARVGACGRACVSVRVCIPVCAYFYAHNVLFCAFFSVCRHTIKANDFWAKLGSVRTASTPREMADRQQFSEHVYAYMHTYLGLLRYLHGRQIHVVSSPGWRRGLVVVEDRLSAPMFVQHTRSTDNLLWQTIPHLYAPMWKALVSYIYIVSFLMNFPDMAPSPLTVGAIFFM